ncbi:MAG: SDR family oxidoreductase [Acidimicrobiales bacterium]|nr:SDR family oxidoreductase [Acidimicrobiales bacterium]
MELADKVVVVTGGGNGIGRALARRIAAEGARGVAVVDRDAVGAEATASDITAAGGRALALAANVAVEAELVGAVERTETAFGPIDLFCANAGIGLGAGPETPDDDWQRIWEVNVMAHVRAARVLLPGWLARGEGYFLATASAAGLLTQIGSAPYAVTKHATVAFAEWLAITYGDQGLRVSCLCPQGVRTQMLVGDIGSAASATVIGAGQVLEPDDVADVVVAGLAEERFLILPHPEVLTYLQRKTGDYDRWLSGMRRLQARVRAEAGEA